MKKMIALKRCIYEGRSFAPGEEFVVEDKHELFFTRIGLARSAQRDVAVTVGRGRKKQTYKTRMLVAE